MAGELLAMRARWSSHYGDTGFAVSGSEGNHLAKTTLNNPASEADGGLGTGTLLIFHPITQLAFNNCMSATPSEAQGECRSRGCSTVEKGRARDPLPIPSTATLRATNGRRACALQAFLAGVRSVRVPLLAQGSPHRVTSLDTRSSELHPPPGR